MIRGLARGGAMSLEDTLDIEDSFLAADVYVEVIVILILGEVP
jgi:hypothetical protein